ncbi:STAS domain-containing protein [Streptomyces sp. NPDC015131]|uniref:STAS domain-containing protein n=1 Tax=Streptomyces sp. NPDC015131 TaxID=3364941 RepID=UPI0036F81A26
MTEEFRITATARPGGGTTLAVSGELDIVTGEELRTSLQDLLPRSPTVLVDLSGVTFLDCSGLGVLLWARRRARTTGTRLLLPVASAAVERILGTTRLHTAFTRPGLPWTTPPPLLAAQG